MARASVTNETLVPPPTVSVVICAYTEKRWGQLCEAVASVSAQSVPVREVIVCTDHNADLAMRARRHLAKAAGAAPRVTVVENRYEGHLGSARNTGVEEASGEIVAFLDDDAAAHPDWLKFLLEPYAQPGVVAVGGAPLPIFETARPRWFPPQLDWVFGCAYDGLPTTRQPVRRLIGASMSARRGALQAIGGFHSDNHDDMDMCHRLAALRPAPQILYEPRAVVFHHVGAERVTWRYFWRRCFFVNKGKVRAFRDMGDAANLDADLAFVIRSVRRSAGALFHGRRGHRVDGLLRLAALLVGIALAAGGHMAGRWEGRHGITSS
jgi:GT2 family glycosyltransferase